MHWWAKAQQDPWHFLTITCLGWIEDKLGGVKTGTTVSLGAQWTIFLITWCLWLLLQILKSAAATKNPLFSRISKNIPSRHDDRITVVIFFCLCWWMALFNCKWSEATIDKQIRHIYIFPLTWYGQKILVFLKLNRFFGKSQLSMSTLVSFNNSQAFRGILGKESFHCLLGKGVVIILYHNLAIDQGLFIVKWLTSSLMSGNNISLKVLVN